MPLLFLDLLLVANNMPQGLFVLVLRWWCVLPCQWLSHWQSSCTDECCKSTYQM